MVIGVNKNEQKLMIPINKKTLFTLAVNGRWHARHGKDTMVFSTLISIDLSLY